VEPTVLRIGHESHQHFLAIEPERSGYTPEDSAAMEVALGRHRREAQEEGSEFYDDSALDSLICDVSQFIQYYLLAYTLENEEAGTQVRRIGDLMLASLAGAAVSALDTMAVLLGDDEEEEDEPPAEGDT